MPGTPWRLPARIETERLVLRRYEATDADEMSRVIFASCAHLSPFMPWARAEPLSPHDRAALLATFMNDFDAAKDFTIGIFERNGGAYVGGTGFHTRLGEGILEIGFWIAVDHEGRGYITEAVLAQTRVALGFAGAERVEIHHVPGNTRSRAVAQRCGYSFEGRAQTFMPGVPELEPTDMWAATAVHLAKEPLASFPAPRLVDADGSELPWPTS